MTRSESWGGQPRVQNEAWGMGKASGGCDMQSGPGLARSGARKGVLVGGNSMREGAGARGDLGLSEKQKKGVGGLESIEQ